MDEKTLPLTSIIKCVANFNWTVLIFVRKFIQIDNFSLNFHRTWFVNFSIHENSWVCNRRYHWGFFHHWLQIVSPIQSTQGSSGSTSDNNVGCRRDVVLLFEPLEMSSGDVGASEIELGVFVLERGYGGALVEGTVAVAENDFGPVGELVFGWINWQVSLALNGIRP